MLLCFSLVCELLSALGCVFDSLLSESALGRVLDSLLSVSYAAVLNRLRTIYLSISLVSRSHTVVVLCSHFSCI